MSINFPTLQSLTIPEGKVKQITDASGRVIWGRTEPVTSGPVILEVAKITSNTYAGETLYENEQFILLDIYPKTANSTIDVTYGGLTKTLTFIGTNAKQVFFGTFNGVTDSVTTPEKGTLTIEGACGGFEQGTYYHDSAKLASARCRCILAVTNWGSITFIPDYTFNNEHYTTFAPLPNSLTSIGERAFYGCTNLALTSLPNSLTSIGNYAFCYCSSLALTSLPSGITSIGDSVFQGCDELALTSLPNSLTSIGNSAFADCTSLVSIIIPDSVTSIGNSAFSGCSSITSITIPDSVTSLGASTFYSCDMLANIIIGDGLTHLSYGVLRYFGGSLERSEQTVYVCLGKSITSMGENSCRAPYRTGHAGDNILEMTSVTPPTIYFEDANTDTLDGYWDKIIVPKGCGEVYKTAEGWSEYANKIVEAS